MSLARVPILVTAAALAACAPDISSDASSAGTPHSSEDAGVPPPADATVSLEHVVLLESTHVISMAFDGQHVFVSTLDAAGPTLKQEILSIPVEGGAPTTLLSVDGVALGTLAGSATQLFFVHLDGYASQRPVGPLSLWALPTAGGAVQDLGAVSENGGVAQAVADGDRWIYPINYPGDIDEITTTGRTGTLGHGATRLLAARGGRTFAALSLSASDGYAGQRISLVDGAVHELARTARDWPVDALAVDDQSVIWSESNQDPGGDHWGARPPSHVRRVPVDGGAATTLFEGQVFLAAMDARDVYLYQRHLDARSEAEVAPPTLARMPKAGGAVQQLELGPGDVSNVLTTDDSPYLVMFSTADGQSGHPSIVRATK